MRKIPLFLLISIGLGYASSLDAQVSISPSNAPPHASAILDLQGTEKGFLVPRVTTAQRTNIASPAYGLIVFDIDLQSFFFYANTNDWQMLLPASKGWLKAGNNAGTNEFMGTTNYQSLVFKANNEQAGKIDLNLENTLFGRNAGEAFTSGLFNTGIGRGALQSATMGNVNTAVGSYALSSAINANSNVALGSNAMRQNVSGSFNTGVGVNALYYNTNATENTAVGFSSLLNTTASFNTAVGAKSLETNTTGILNVAVGYLALTSSINGSVNTAIGVHSMAFNTSGSDNTSVGGYSLRNNSIGNDNTAIGTSALTDNTQGDFNTAVGEQSMFKNTTGDENTSTGQSSLHENTTGTMNAAFGRNALYSNTNGINNTAAGHNSLYGNTTGDYNTAFGSESLAANTTGIQNVAIGRFALANAVVANYNTAVGGYALESVVDSWNTSIGYDSGDNGPTNSRCTYVGYDADNFNFNDDFNNSVAIGYQSRMTASNQVRIGNSSMTSIGGYENWSNISDGRFKQDVQENVPGLEFISKLRPVTYHLDIEGLAQALHEEDPDENLSDDERQGIYNDRLAKSMILETGFIAQEVEAAANEIGYSFSGVEGPTSTEGLYALRYAEFVVPLVKAAQELQAEVEALKARVAELEARAIRE